MITSPLLPDVRIFTVDEYDYEAFKKIPIAKRRPGNPGQRQIHTQYKDAICAFDIETTRIAEIEQAIMYLWQFAIDENNVVFGRTWEELTLFLRWLTDGIGDAKVVVWVHNLSYEFHFLRGVFPFSTADVFAVDNRKVLKAKLGPIEFRCSYLHSNMSLDAFMKKMGVEQGKITGFDYSKIRYPWTPLNDRELAYGVQDVVGLVKALRIEMEHDRDSLYTVPLTSTGYVRRDAKRAMRSISHEYVARQLPDYLLYKMLHDAFRGGNCHANRAYSGMILRGVKSADRSSSYPDNQCNDIFPVGPFFHSGHISNKQLVDLINRRRRAVVMRVSIYGNVRLKDPDWPVPYLSISKCEKISDTSENQKAVFDNGRIISCGYLETTITDVDLMIILDEYRFDHIYIWDSYHARYGPLPPPIIKTTISYYRAKTELKGVPGQDLYYTKAKNKLNSIYGMMAQDPGKLNIEYTGQPDDLGNIFRGSGTEEECFEKNMKRAFAPYQWGVWITAWSRYRLEEGIRAAHNAKGVSGGFVYCDTDSVKYIGEVDWTAFNRERIRASTASGAFAYDPKGNVHYMGVFEDEGEYDRFRTWGAKKYVYEKGGKLFATIAGVAKNPDNPDRPDGGRELLKHGGLEAFREGFVFKEAGGTESVYNDFPEISEIEIDSRKLPITANVVIRDSTYMVGITSEYAELLRVSQPGLLDDLDLDMV